MSEHGAKPVLWSTVLFRVALLLVLLAALAVAFAPKLVNLFSPNRRVTTSGDPADIRLVGVLPDGDDVLFDGRGNVIPGANFDWPGKRTYTWPQGSMLREFLFELGPGLENLDFSPNNPGTIQPAEKRTWIQNVSCTLSDDRVASPEGRQRVLLRVAMHTNYWRRGFVFGGRQSPLQEIELDLHFFGNTRSPAALSFDGPFAVGKTNSSRDSLPGWAVLVPLANSSRQYAEGTPFEIQWKGYGGAWSQIFAYDRQGKRHLGHIQNPSPSAVGGTNRFLVSGVPVGEIAAITFGEEPCVKRFHNVLVNYPNRPPRPHAAALDRLAVALGKTNIPATSLEHTYPSSIQEAMTLLEHIPGHRTAVIWLATGSNTNFSGLTSSQRDKVRGLAAKWAGSAEVYEREMGLRLGLRGSWPEFLALALTRLTNGSARDRSQAVNLLAWSRAQIGEEHAPLLVALARTNEGGKITSSLLALLQRAGPAGTNALLELARAEQPWLWWGAMLRLPTRVFEPLSGLSQEMQERVWLVKERASRTGSNAVATAALARLPELLTPELHREESLAFFGVLRQLQRHADPAVAMAAMMKFLRDLPPEQARSHPPVELVRLVNTWYRQDFGGLGNSASNARRTPSPEVWPDIVNEVLQFYEKLRRDGAVTPVK